MAPMVERAEGGAGEGFAGEIGGEVRGLSERDRGEADAVDGDAVSGAPAACECGGGEDQARGSFGGCEGDDGAGGFDESGEHRYRVTRSGGGDVGPGVVEVAGDADVFGVGGEVGGEAWRG